MRTHYQQRRRRFLSFSSPAPELHSALAALALSALPLAPQVFADEEHDHDHDHESLHQILHGHADIGIAFDGSLWDFHVAAGEAEHDHDHGEIGTLAEDDHDDDHGDVTEYAPGEAEFVLNAMTARTVPADPQYSFLGSAGTIYYSLPENGEEAELLDTIFLGINTEEIADGLFENNQISLRLLEVHGPGDFFGFQTDEFGQVTPLLSTVDGWPDTMTLLTGGHVHMNWAFTQLGEYELTFEAFGTLDTGGQLGGLAPTSSGPVTYNYAVIPEPSGGLLVLLGLLMMATLRNRKRRSSGK